MSALLSNSLAAADNNADISVGMRPVSEAEAILEAKTAFDRWWQAMPRAHRLKMDSVALWRAWKEGWLSMARELGQLPPLANGRAA